MARKSPFLGFFKAIQMLPWLRNVITIIDLFCPNIPVCRDLKVVIMGWSHRSTYNFTKKTRPPTLRSLVTPTYATGWSRQKLSLFYSPIDCPTKMFSLQNCYSIWVSIFWNCKYKRLIHCFCRIFPKSYFSQNRATKKNLDRPRAILFSAKKKMGKI